MNNSCALKRPFCPGFHISGLSCTNAITGTFSCTMAVTYMPALSEGWCQLNFAEGAVQKLDIPCPTDIKFAP